MSAASATPHRGHRGVLMAGSLPLVAPRLSAVVRTATNLQHVGPRPRGNATKGQQGERFPQGHHQCRAPLGQRAGVHVEEGQRPGFEEDVQFGRIQQGMEG